MQRKIYPPTRSVRPGSAIYWRSKNSHDFDRVFHCSRPSVYASKAGYVVTRVNRYGQRLFVLRPRRLSYGRFLMLQTISVHHQARRGGRFPFYPGMYDTSDPL